MTETEAAWLAGLLEGEGCFTLATPTCIRVYVKMTDKDVVERAAALMECRSVRPVKTKDGWSDAWETAISGKRARPIMERVLPYMGHRRSARIKELLAR